MVARQPNYKYDRANQQDGEKHGRQLTCKQGCQCKSKSAIAKKPSNDLTRWNRYITGIDIAPYKRKHI